MKTFTPSLLPLFTPQGHPKAPLVLTLSKLSLEILALTLHKNKRYQSFYSPHRASLPQLFSFTQKLIIEKRLNYTTLKKCLKQVPHVGQTPLLQQKLKTALQLIITQHIQNRCSEKEISESLTLQQTVLVMLIQTDSLPTSQPSSTKPISIQPPQHVLLTSKQMEKQKDDRLFTRLYAHLSIDRHLHPFCPQPLLTENHRNKKITQLQQLCRNNLAYDTLKKIITRVMTDDPAIQVQWYFNVLRSCHTQNYCKHSYPLHQENEVLLSLFINLRVFEHYPKTIKNFLLITLKKDIRNINCRQHHPKVTPNKIISDPFMLQTLSSFHQTRKMMQYEARQHTPPHSPAFIEHSIASKENKLVISNLYRSYEMGCAFQSNNTVVIANRQDKTQTFLHEITHLCQKKADRLLDATSHATIKKILKEVLSFVRHCKRRKKHFNFILNLKQNQYHLRQYAEEIHAEITGILSQHPQYRDLMQQHCPITNRWVHKINDTITQRFKRSVPLKQRASSRFYTPQLALDQHSKPVFPRSKSSKKSTIRHWR